MAAKEFPLSVVIRAVDRMTGPLRGMASRLDAFGDRVRSRFDGLVNQPGLRRITDSVGRLGGALGDLGRQVGTLAVGFAALGGVAVAAIGRSILSFAEAGGALNDASVSIGISAEKLQELRYAAQQTGVEAEALDGSLMILNRNLGKAFQGKGPADLLAAMKVELRDSNGQFRTMDALLPEIASGLAAIKNPALRAQAAAELFGRSGGKLLPMLADGAEGLDRYAAAARRLGIVISNEAVAQADEFGDRFDDLKLSFEGVRNIIGTSLMPVLTQLVQDLTNFVVGNGPAIRKWFDEFAQNLPGHLADLKSGFDSVRAAVSPIVNVVRALSNQFGGANVLMAGLATILVATLVPGLIAVTTAIWSLTVAMYANPIGLIIAAVLLAIGVFAYFAVKIEDGKFKLTEFGQSIVDFFKSVGKMWKGVYDIFAAFFTGLAKWIADGVRGFIGLYDSIVSGAQRAIEWVANLGRSLVDMIPDWAQNLFGMGGGTVTINSNAAGAPLGARAAAGAAGQNGQVKVQVDLNGLPPGSRVRTEDSGFPGFELNQGYSFGGG